jgi:hypothetical protein
MKKEFTSGQKEILARKLGYEGPMQGFESFLASSPALSAKYNMVTNKYVQRMAKGGLTSQRLAIKKYAAGGLTLDQAYQQVLGRAPESKEARDYWVSQFGNEIDETELGTLRGVAQQTEPASVAAVNALSAQSTPQQIATAYRTAIANAGGDTPENQAKAVEYLRNLGVPDAVTQEAYKVATPALKAATAEPAAQALAAQAPAAPIPQTVDELYKTVLGRKPENPEVAKQWADNLLADGKITAEEMNLFKEAAKSELSSSGAVPQTVDELYKTVLGREPENPEVAKQWADSLLADGVITAAELAVFKEAAAPELKSSADAAAKADAAAAKAEAERIAAEKIKALEDKLAAATTEADRIRIQNELNVEKRTQAELGSKTTVGEFGKPVRGTAPTTTAAQITADDEQDVGTTGLAPKTATQGTADQAGAAQTVAAPTPMTAKTMSASDAAAGVQKIVDKLKPATGTVTQQVTAAEQAPTTTAVGGVQAATGQAQQVVAPVARKAQAGEMISGTGVDMTQAEALAAQTAASAAQGTVTEDMTVQGQLNKVLANFDAGKPPPWAASTMRSAVAQMAARGLSASSMAGQAIVQAAMEAAVPIASADAKVFEQMGLQNLSNRQQTAVLAAQQRAAFLGQEFDQAFQMRVANAAKVSDIANMNFTASQQIALENARLTQNMDLANLSNQQAVVMAEAAQIATLETTNLNNRQQAQVVNAQNFLQMDLANLDNEQQTTLFKAQATTNALLADTAAENAAKQFNATSENQTNQFMASLTSQVSQFNAAQKNAVEQFNVDQANAIEKFNTESQNIRDQFNSTQRLVIDQSNAQWRREISTANTAAANSANYLNAQILQAMTLAEYNNEIVLYRDQIQQAFDAFENSEERAAAILTATITGDAASSAARTESKGNLAVELGKWALKKWG